MDKKSYALAGALVGFGIVIFCTRLWQPERQVRLHQLHLIEAVEKRNWSRFSGFISPNYSDRWQHDRNFLLKEPQEVFRQFLSLTLVAQERSLTVQNGNGLVTSQLTLTGNGGPLAQFAVQKVAELRSPFTFEWKQKSWKPWDWELVRFDQPELEIPEF